MAKTNPGRITTSFKVPGRNKFDLSHRFSFNAQFGEIYPVAHFPMTPATRLQLTPSAIVRTAALSHPLMTQARARLYAFWVPDRLYVPQILRNSNIDEVVYPQMRMNNIALETEIESLENDESTPLDIAASGVYNVLSGSLLQFIGFGSGVNFKQLSTQTGNFGPSYSAMRVLGYYDIVRNYFANRCEEYFAYKAPLGLNYKVIHEYFFDVSLEEFYEDRKGKFRNLNTAARLSSDLVGIAYESLQAIDSYYDSQSWFSQIDQEPTYELPISDANGHSRDLLWIESKAGLALKSYMPDMLNSFVQTDQFEDAIARSLVRLSEQSGVTGLNIQELIGGKKLYDFLVEKIATGGQMDQLMRTQFGVDVSGDLDIPMLLRTWSFDIDFNAVSGTGSENLGELGGIGYGSMSGTTDRGKRKKSMILDFGADQFGEVYIYMTIEPYCDYGLNIDPFLSKTNLTDHFWPAFDRSGFQPLIASEVQAFYPSLPITPGGNRYYTADGRYISDYNPLLNQVGMQPTYTEYMGKTNRVAGDFADVDNQLNKWTFLRQLALNWRNGIGDVDWTSYIDASIFNGAFKDTSLASYPFYVTVGFNATAKMPISRNQLTTNL